MKNYLKEGKCHFHRRMDEDCVERKTHALGGVSCGLVDYFGGGREGIGENRGIRNTMKLLEEV